MEQAYHLPRSVYDFSVRNNRYWNAFQILGALRLIHRSWDFDATRDIDPKDLVIFAEGDEDQAIADKNVTDLEERWL